MDESSSKSHGPRMVPRWVFTIVAILLVGAPLGVSAALQFSPGSDSPASGHSQVVTQGIAEISADQVVWRLVERTARPRWEAIPARRVLGFILASEEPVLLSNFADSGVTDVARLAPGEAMMVTDITRTLRASFTDQSTRYFALELVPADEADDVGSGTLLFKSDPFAPPSGDRDIDLVRNVLELTESATVPDSGQQNVVLATEGAIDVIPGDGRTTRLEAGESMSFEGELEIQAAQPSGANVVPVAALTAYLAQDQPNRSSYVVAVIGEEIPPPTTPTPTPTNTPTPTPTFTATPIPSDTPIPPPTSTPTVAPPIKPTFTPTLAPPTDTPFPDSDGDGLNDVDEVTCGSSPRLPDADGDGLNDFQECVTYGTDPNNSNIDDDACTDYDETVLDPQDLYDPYKLDCRQPPIP